MMRALTLFAVAAGLASLAFAAPAAAQVGPWMAIGDSFSSGEGIPKLDDKCQRADGKQTEARAWSAGAYEELRSELDLGPLRFTACTGEITDDARKQIAEAKGRAGAGPFAIATLSFGGNNIGFSKVILDCLFPSFHWGEVRTSAAR